jgi:hypothetical protein
MNRLFAPMAGLILALLIASGALVARAKEPRLDPPDTVTNGVIASIDMEEVYNASGAPQELEQAAREHEAQGAQRINQVMAVPYLEPTELEEFGTLIGKAKMTPVEQKRADELKAVNDQRTAELRTLQTKNNAELTADEKTRLGHLIDLKQTLQTQVRPGLVADFRGQQEGWVAEFRHHQIVKLRQEVAKVAKEKGIAHVFDAGTLVYSVLDVTPGVLQRLAKHNGVRGKE